MRFKFLIFILSFVILFFVSFIIKTILKFENSKIEFKSISNSLQDTFFLNKLSHYNDYLIINKFPYNSYLKYCNYKDISLIKNDLAILDLVNENDRTQNRMIFFILLTDSLSNSLNYDDKEINLDELNSLIMWIIGFKYYAKIDSENNILFNGIYDYWMNFVSNKLTSYTMIDPNIKYNSKFQFLENICRENKYSVSIKINSIDKFIYNISNKNWNHLFTATWNQTSIFQKLFFLIFLILTIYAYVFTIFKIFFSK